jgi:c-di-GMP-binding flagellar brake protein YcgR
MTFKLGPQEIFTKISDPEQKNKIFKTLVADQGEVVAKLPEPMAEVFIAKAQDLTNKKLILKLIKTTIKDLESGPLILTFYANNEKYFLQTEYSVQHGDIYLSIETPIFHLQRREDYRIRIPTSSKAKFEITTVNKLKNKVPFTLLDLSGGGCKVQWNSYKLAIKVGDHLAGQLILPDRKPIVFEAKVQHLHENPIDKTNQIGGIQFEGLSEVVKNRIVALVLDLYREFFSGRLN